MKRGVWIVGDQCSRTATSLAAAGADAPVVFVESKKFCQRRPYHWQKLVLILSTMRHFAEELRNAGRCVEYFRLAEDFVTALRAFVAKYKIDVLYVMEPNDFDRATIFPTLGEKIGCRVELTPNNQFLATHEEFGAWATGKKQLVMEYFYRTMRKRDGVLMEKDGSPLGGDWNFDKLNREALPAGKKIPEPRRFEPDALTREVIADVHTHFSEVTFGRTGSSEVMARDFIWPVTPEQAEEALDVFLRERLGEFGPFEDAMTRRSWSLWHSHLSVAMNCGLLHPKRILDKTMAFALPRIQAGTLAIQSVEGFVRQVMGWREFMRGIYWREMRKKGEVPYPQRNVLGATHDLPAFYWTGETDMACVADVLKPVLTYGYSHHISRLMVLGNFALLHGIDPQQVNEWFIYAYADGYEWVTTPNVVGMSLYADGGIVATKPYIGGGAYIHKMSDYCKGCRYSPSVGSGERACPFTRAYWPFVQRHRERLARNPRTVLMTKALAKMKTDEVATREREMQGFLKSLPIYQPRRG